MRPPSVYNEIDPHAAEWLARLSAAGEIALGDVDARSIVDLRPEDLAGRAQFHAFAGIGVWSRALRDAGVSDDFPVWTGSCPCQPFSNAGSRKGTSDARHLWPDWFRLIRECRPPVILGEQVASPDGLAWLDAVYADLEGAGYAVGAADLCAAGVGAPHGRQRLFFVAYAYGARQRIEFVAPTANGDASSGPDANTCGADGVVGYAERDRVRQHDRELPRDETQHVDGATHGDHDAQHPGAAGYWADAEWIPCSDGKIRPVEPGAFPLVDGSTFPVERSRAKEVKGYGNAIVLPLAVEFIRAALGL